MGTLLAIDAGNTNVVIGAYRGAELLATWRTATAVSYTHLTLPTICSV